MDRFRPRRPHTFHFRVSASNLAYSLCTCFAHQSLSMVTGTSSPYALIPTGATIAIELLHVLSPGPMWYARWLPAAAPRQDCVSSRVMRADAARFSTFCSSQ